MRDGRGLSLAVMVMMGPALVGCGGPSSQPLGSEAAAPSAGVTSPTMPPEEPVLQPPTPTPRVAKGLVVVTWMSGGSLPRVTMLDPQDGEVTSETSFDAPEGVSFDDWYNRLNGGWSRVVRRSFSPDFSKVVAVRSNEGGAGNSSSHAGFVDASGSFVDLTAMAPAAGDFDSSTDSMSAFGDDGSFYFARRPQSSGMSAGDISTLFKVAPGESSVAPATITFEDSRSSTTLGYSLTPKGVLPMGAGQLKWIWTAAGDKGCWAPSDVSAKGWCVEEDDTRITLKEAVPYSEWGSGNAPEIKTRAVLPETNNRAVRNPIFSPDGSQIAFMAEDSTGTEGYDLYVVSVDGGEPRKVTLGVQLAKNQQLVSWL